MSNIPEPEVISIRMPSRLELLAMIDGVTTTVCERMHFNEETSSLVSMSVIEAGTNAIQHGHHKDASKPVDVEFRLSPEALEVIVKDEGTGFDLSGVNGDITSPEHIFDARGRGIFIMRSCMDHVDFEFTKTGTRVRLIKKRTVKAENR